jgi:hypothetical protein
MFNSSWLKDSFQESPASEEYAVFGLKVMFDKAQRRLLL